MHFTSLLALLLAIAPAAEFFMLPELPPPGYKQHICGNPDPSAVHLNTSSHLAELERQRKAAGHLEQRTPIIIDTWFHVVAGGRTKTKGFVSNQTISNQLDRLNEDYAPHAISFRHRGTTHTVNSIWSIWKAPDLHSSFFGDSIYNHRELDMRKHLRKGSYTTLNVYVLEGMEFGFEGLCYPPRDLWGISDVAPDEGLKAKHELFWMDGCLIDHNTLTGGEPRLFEWQNRTGATLTHEVGHWLGLLHPFQNGCDEPGDFIDDTPAQGWPFFECEDQADSCKTDEGNDPVHNHMGYASDQCRTEFTVGQGERMHSTWQALRLPLHGLDPDELFNFDKSYASRAKQH